MTMAEGNLSEDAWKTKPTDRFILKWIKCNLSARITPRLTGLAWLRPWMITLGSALVGTLAGAVFALGHGFPAACIAAAAQVLDGVDGQFARLTNAQTKGGAFMDSVLDRYSDGAMMIGMTVYLVWLPAPVAPWLLLVVGSAALIGTNLISYSSARAEALGIDLGPPTLASKGTRTTVMVLGGLGSAAWPPLPLVALVYLAVHATAVVAGRLIRAAAVRTKP
ncbi:CDP-alcohol phosphatidyltransferase family protein [Thermodesulfobacteriota bacterium]